jgi:hypothetical protein
MHCLYIYKGSIRFKISRHPQKERFSALLHHLTIDLLKAAYSLINLRLRALIQDREVRR